MSDDTIERLFERFRSRGDVEAFSRLFDELAPDLFGLACRLCREPAEAEDVLQATFVTLIERADAFDPERSFVPWATGILANHARAARRVRRREVAEADRPAESGADSRLVRDAASEASEREFRAAVAAALADLPPSYRAVLEPHLAHDKRASELAAELGLSPGAVRVRLHRGLALLRRALPIGYVAETAASPASARGLASVRSSVVAAARAATTPSAVPLLGGALVSQRSLVAAVALAVLLGGALWVLRGERPAPQAPGALSAGAVLEAASDDASAASAELAAPAEVAGRVRAHEATGVAPSGAVLYTGRVVAHGSEEPLAAAVVSTQPAGAVERVERARTGADGRFAFRGTADEERTLRVDASDVHASDVHTPDYAPLRMPLDPVRRALFGVRTGRRASEDGSEVDLGTLALHPGVALAGRVLRAADRSPVAGAELLVFWQDLYGTPTTFDDHVLGRSDDDGALRFDGRLPIGVGEGDGNFVVVALAAEGCGVARAPLMEDSTRIDGVEVLVHVGPVLEVRVVGPDGVPVPGARVALAPLTSPFPRAMGALEARGFWPPPLAWTERFERRTDPAGAARFTALLTGVADPPARIAHYAIGAEADGYAPRVQSETPPTDAPWRVVLELERLVETRFAGRVVDADGAPFAGALVRLHGYPVETRSDESGSFALVRPAGPRSTVVLAASAEGYVEHLHELHVPGSQARVADLELVLRRPARIAGVVVDQHGVPVEGAKVMLTHAQAEHLFRPATRGTDVDGGFAHDATEGAWLAHVAPPQPFLDWIRPEPTPVQGGDEDVRLVLERRESPPTRLVVTVVDALTGAPIDASNVMLVSIDGASAHGLAQRGSGRVEYELRQPGRYVVWVAAEGYANGHTLVRVPPEGGEQRARIELGAPARLTGRVKLNGMPRPDRMTIEARLDLGGASVPGGDAWRERSQQSAREPVSAGDAFTLPNLTPGPWVVRLEARGLLAEQRVDVPVGGEEHVVLRAEPAAVLELEAEVSPGRGWIVPEIRRPDGEWDGDRILSGSIDPTRPIALTLPPGRVEWRVRFVETTSLDSDLVAQDQTGEADLASGETRHVLVPVIPVE